MLALAASLPAHAQTKVVPPVEAPSPSPTDSPSPEPSVEPVPDDADRESLLLALERTQTYLANVRRPTLGLLGHAVPIARFRDTADRMAILVRDSWGTPAFDRAMHDEFEWLMSPGADGRGAVRFTGYHLPLLEARTQPDATYKYPLYGPPTDQLHINLGAFRPELAGQTLLGRLAGSAVVPYYSREEIDDQHALAGRGLEIAWVSDELARFSLMVQGSGILRYEDGHTINVNYAGQNGHPYVGLGKVLAAEGRIPLKQLSMPTIAQYFSAHPDDLHRYLGRNHSYVFFKLAKDGPFGVDGITLTAGRSIATDKRIFPSGALSYLRYPRARFDAQGNITRWDAGARFVLDQDTGGAILGPGRVDIFYGGGEEAARRAGTLNGPGQLAVLLLKERSVAAPRAHQPG